MLHCLRAGKFLNLSTTPLIRIERVDLRDSAFVEIFLVFNLSLPQLRTRPAVGQLGYTISNLATELKLDFLREVELAGEVSGQGFNFITLAYDQSFFCIAHVDRDTHQFLSLRLVELGCALERLRVGRRRQWFLRTAS